MTLLLLWRGMFIVGFLVPATGSAADPATIAIAMRLDNISGFSTREKTFSVDGTLWLSYSDELAGALDARNIKPIDLILFQNRLNPWDSTIDQLTHGHARLASGRQYSGYQFAATFYANEIDYQHFPFGGITLSVVVEPRVGAAELLGRELRVAVVPDGAELGSRAGLSGYDLDRWAFVDEAYKRSTKIVGGAAATESRAVFNVYYTANNYAAAVKWVLPLTVVMLIMLLTPSLSGSLVSERLAVPPTILLTIALMQQSYRENLPSVPYLTFLDKLYAYSFVVTLAFFLSFIWAANAQRASSRTDDVGQAGRRSRVDLATQALTLVGYILIVAISA
ncbi:hypothetical protein [Reyranella sp.]|uniref:hypothetical protein n=1 Tax=Reyranella sp. TaxID=1929291 RepID=UPI003D12C710